MHPVEVDRIDITVIVDNELDPISPSRNPAAASAGRMRGVPLEPLSPSDPRVHGGASLELRMDHICCAAHGLSLMITATRGDTAHTLLFDAGPEEDVWERNVRRLQLQDAIGTIEHIHLSHWHRDHSGGLPQAVRMVTAAAAAAAAEATGKRTESTLLLDLHPDRPAFRGMEISGAPDDGQPSTIISLEADPTLDELRNAGVGSSVGVVVETHAEPHTVLDDFFLVSGEIPRRTAYEEGLRGGMRYVKGEGEAGAIAASGCATHTGHWQPDRLIRDERLVACRLRGQGLVVFTGCSHAGVVNTCRHALDLAGPLHPGSDSHSGLHAIVGGFHLADADAERMKHTLADLTALRPAVVMAGHCTGWRFKFLYEQAMPGVLVPSFVGSKYTMQGR